MPIPIDLYANYPVVRELKTNLSNVGRRPGARGHKALIILRAWLDARDDGSTPGQVLDAIEIAARELLEGV